MRALGCQTRAKALPTTGVDLIAALLLGLVQGATEFLPVSSSGHLALGQAVLGTGEADLLFDIILHVGTLLAVCAVYHRDVVSVCTGGFQGVRALLTGQGIAAALRPEGARLAVLVAVATIPTGIIGVVIDKTIGSVGPTFVGTLLIINAAILVVSKTRPRGFLAPSGPLSLWQIGLLGALAIGIAQGIAVFPGLSRSGMTITACLLVGAVREDAARFSFLLSIPAILGALVLKFDTSLFTGADPERLLRFGVGAAVAAISGYVCLRLLIAVLRRAAFHHFAWYCLAVGITAILWDQFAT